MYIPNTSSSKNPLNLELPQALNSFDLQALHSQYSNPPTIQNAHEVFMQQRKKNMGFLNQDQVKNK